MTEKLGARTGLRRVSKIASAVLFAHVGFAPGAFADPANRDAGVMNENPQTPQTPQAPDFSRSPLLIQDALRIVFDETTPAESRSLSDTVDAQEVQTAAFHARDARGRMELYQVSATTDLANNHVSLSIRVCTDRNREEVGSDVIQCADEGQDGVEFTDTNLDGVVDGILVQNSAPLLLGETFTPITRGDHDWNEAQAQRAFEQALLVVERQIHRIGSEDSSLL